MIDRPLSVRCVEDCDGGGTSATASRYTPARSQAPAIGILARQNRCEKLGEQLPRSRPLRKITERTQPVPPPKPGQINAWPERTAALAARDLTASGQQAVERPEMSLLSHRDQEIFR